MNRTELKECLSRAQAAMEKLPGVVGVGYGLKEVEGEITDERAFRVYVKVKRPLNEVAEEERIPEEFEGIPTDVVLVDEHEPLHCQDIEQHDPLIGGISITNFKGGQAATAGTIGFFATMNGVSGPKNVVIVTNSHVIKTNNGVNGDIIYQPKFVVVDPNIPTIPMDDSDESRRTIGTIHNVGVEGNHSFTYPGEASSDYYLDCGTVKLNISVSSWCNTNCGVSYKNEIRGLNIGGNSKIHDVSRVDAGDVGAIVFKVGRTTSKTKGKILDADAPAASGGRIIVIIPEEPDCDGVKRFAVEGDSGAAIINSQNDLVGLLYARSTTNPDRIYASHIHPVLDVLKVTAISEANPPVGPAGQARSDVEGILADGINETITLRERLLATPRGAEIYARFLEHREEVVALVNHCRPVTVAWHRGKGPEFLSHMVENARNRAHLIPFEIDGRDRKALISRMADVLIAHGSSALGAAIAAHRAEVLTLIDQFDDLHAFVGRFEEAPADA